MPASEKKVSAKKRITNDRYNSKCDAINIRPILQGYILQAVAERMERDSQK